MSQRIINAHFQKPVAVSYSKVHILGKNLIELWKTVIPSVYINSLKTLKIILEG